MYRTIVEAVLAHGKEKPDQLAVGFKKTKLTYGELCGQMKIMAAKLQREYGVQKGDFVMYSGLSKPEYIVIYLAVQYLGAVSVPMEKTAKPETIRQIGLYTGPRLIITDSVFESDGLPCCSLRELYASVVQEQEKEKESSSGFDGETLSDRTAEVQKQEEGTDEVLPYVCPEDGETAEILFTTGTTGAPKGAMLSIGNIYAITHNNWHGVGMQESDVVLIPLPLNHSLGMRVMRTTLYIGGSVVLQNGFTFAKEIEKNICQYQCTGMVCVPASLELVCRQMQERFSEFVGKLRYMEIGAGSLGTDMKKKLPELLPNTKIVNTWGSTETGGVIFLDVAQRQDKRMSLGKPVEGILLKTVDQEGKEVNACDMDTAGRMVLQGPMQMKGYYHLPEITAQTLVDGWLYTNDIVYRDSEGFVYMLGRADDIINVGGEKVSPIEVENTAQEYEEIRECACIGVKDPEGILGQVPVLYVVPEEQHLNQEELLKFLAGRLEKYKLPQHIVLISELPRNRMKKLDRKALHARWADTGSMELINETVSTILARRSIRDFTPQPVPKAVLEMILKCGIYAPSGHNMQTWRFTVVQSQEEIGALKECVGNAAKEQKVYFYGFHNPQVLILVSNDRRNANSIQDSACAAENMMLAAQSYGLGSVWLNAISALSDVPEVREKLRAYGIPDTHNVWAMLALGYPEKPGKELAKKTDVVHWIG